MFFVSFVLNVFRDILFFFCWIFWLFSSIFLFGGQSFLVFYSSIRISGCLIIYFIIAICKGGAIRIRKIFQKNKKNKNKSPSPSPFTSKQNPNSHPSPSPSQSPSTYLEFVISSRHFDSLHGGLSWRESVSDDGLYDGPLLLAKQSDLLSSLSNRHYDILFHHLISSGLMDRRFGGLQNAKIYSNAKCHFGTKKSVEKFYEILCESISLIGNPNIHIEGTTIKQRIQMLQKARKSYGRTALCLSGGGALALYHAGVVKSMVDADCLPSVVNGTSGGSIIAGVIATRTLSELRDPHFLTASIANRFGVRWIPRFSDQIRSFLKNRTLVDHEEFIRTAKVYFGEMNTFDSSYKRTGRDVSITVSMGAKNSASSSSNSHRGSYLVLNHIVSPHVLIWSAVTSSCALPGLMDPQILWQKNFDGKIVPFSPEGLQQTFVDGSLRADLPMQRLTELFNAQNVIVSQVNPHVTPFIEDEEEENENENDNYNDNGIPHEGYEVRGERESEVKMDPKNPNPNENVPTEEFNTMNQQRNGNQPYSTLSSSPSPYSSPSHSPSLSSSPSPPLRVDFGLNVIRTLHECEMFLQSDIQHRLRRLAKMGAIPKLYGQDLTGVFNGKQRYTGDITVVPKVSFRMTFKVLSQPTESDMEEFIREGEKATWKKMTHIIFTQKVERAIEQAIKTLAKHGIKQQHKETKQRGETHNVHGPQDVPVVVPQSFPPTPLPLPPILDPSVSLLFEQKEFRAKNEISPKDNGDGEGKGQKNEMGPLTSLSENGMEDEDGNHHEDPSHSHPISNASVPPATVSDFSPPSPSLASSLSLPLSHSFPRNESQNSLSLSFNSLQDNDNDNDDNFSDVSNDDGEGEGECESHSHSHVERDGEEEKTSGEKNNDQVQ